MKKKVIIVISYLWIAMTTGLLYAQVEDTAHVYIPLGDTTKWDVARGRSEFRRSQRLDDDGNLDMNNLLKVKQVNDKKQEMKDGGIWTWEWLGPGDIGGRTRAIVNHPTNPNILFIGGVAGGMWKSEDGGVTWNPLSDFIANLAISSIVMDPNNHNVMYAATGEGFGNADGLTGAGVFKTSDGGMTWNQLVNTSTWKYCNRLAHHPTLSNIIYATVCINTSNSYIGKSTDGGNTWTKVCDVQPYPVDLKICPTDANKMVIGCYNQAFYTGDGGLTLTLLTTNAVNKLAAYAASGYQYSGRAEFAYAPSSPNIVYCSLDYSSGQVYRSTNYGLDWTLMNTGSNYQQGQGWYDNCIVVSPTDPNFILVGGMDIWKSTDGGTTLTKISNWTYAFNQSSFSPHADHHALVFSSGYNGTSNKILYNGSDGGVCKNTDITNAAWNVGWVNLIAGLGLTQFYGGAASPDGSVIIGGTQDNGNLRYRPQDGVNNWLVWAGGDGGFCAINYNNPLIMYQEYIYLLMGKTTNGGLSGTGCSTGIVNVGKSSDFLFIAPYVIDPNNPSILVAGGTSIWRTTNDAASWSSIKEAYTARCSAIAIAKGNSNVIWVGFENGMVSMTTDGGTNWTNVNTGIPARYITDIAIDPTNPNKVVITVGGYVKNHIYLTTNGGTSWTDINGTVPYDIPAVQINTVAIHPTNPGWIYVGTDAGVYASEDWGNRWRVTPRYTKNEGPGNIEVDELFWQGNYLIAATHGRGMYRCLPSKTLYVDLNASSNGIGTITHPFNTMNAAVSNAPHGTTFIIKGTNQVPPYPGVLPNRNFQFIIQNF